MNNTQIDENLTFKHYKEPLRRIPRSEGHGFYGAILMTKDLDKIQCHVCGETHRTLAGHLAKHKMNGKEYKEKYQLAYSTALVSETFRTQLRQKTVDWIKTLTPEQKAEYRIKARENQRWDHEQPKIRLETKNKRGTCPDQLLDQILKVAKKLGKTPSKHEFIGETGTQRYVHLIYITFGSWSKAVEMAGLAPRKIVPKGNTIGRYDDETLYEYLRIFTQENNRVPTFTDFRRGLLPSYETYTRRFGTIQRARDLAGVEEFIEAEL